MYPSNGNNLMSSYSECHQPFSVGSNPITSKQELINCTQPIPPSFYSSFNHFPSSSSCPFEDNNNEIFLQQHHHHHHHHHDELFLHHHHQTLAEAVVNMEMEEVSNSINKNITQQIPRSKRSYRRDRHSKISTARGLRDRRMRLSLEVAKRFFGLQDMLGFDKASKTVEWLLNQARVEIKQLAREKNHSSYYWSKTSASSTSECEEGVSSLDEVAVSGIRNNQEQDQREKPMVVMKRRIKVSRKSAFNPVAREKARERARERTQQKKMRTQRLASADESTKQCREGGNGITRTSSSWNINPFETREDQSSVNPSFQVLTAEAHEEPISNSHAKEHLGTVEDSLMINLSKWSPTMMFNPLNNSGLLLQDLPHQFAEFQSSLGKPNWEPYSNHI